MFYDTGNNRGNITVYDRTGGAWKDLFIDSQNLSIRQNGGTVIYVKSDGKVGIGTTNPGYTLDVAGDINFTGTLYENGSPFVTGQWSDAGTYIYANNASNVVVTDAGRLGVGTTTPGAQLHSLATTEQLRLGYDASNYVSFSVANTSALTIQTATSADITLDAGSGTVYIGDGTGKLDAGTVDPKYNIGGTTYITYMPSMAGGVKEEITGVVKLQQTSYPSLFTYIIDFNNLKEGSDLWIFSRVVDWGENMENLVVLLSSEENAEVSYKKDPANNRLIIFGNQPCEVSYRLTAPRFDYEKWPSIADEEDQGKGFVVPEFPLKLDSDGSVEIDLQELADSLSDEEDKGFFDNLQTSILNFFSSVGATIRDGVLSFTHLIVDKLIVKELEVQNSMILRSPSGKCFKVTVSDEGSLSSTPIDCSKGEVISQTAEETVTTWQQTTSGVTTTIPETTTTTVATTTTTTQATTTSQTTTTTEAATTTEATTTPSTSSGKATTTDTTTTAQETTSTEPVCQPSEEICDGQDNDCDGQIDENLTQQCGSSDVGACQFGTQTCQNGVWSECQGAIEPVEEICNDGVDNNCDGQVDEGCTVEPPVITDSATTTDSQ